MEGVRNFIGIEAIPSGNIRILDKTELVTTIQKDPNALGFCLLTDITDPEKQLCAENILLLPIDRNMNGKVDYLESFYDDLNMFSRAVWIGKYPRPLYTDIHIISKDQPTGAAETAFLSWIMTSGQPYLALNGYSDLAYTERQSRLDKINNITLNLPPVEEANSIPKLVLLISLAVLFAGLIIGTALRYGRNRSLPLPESPKSGPGIFDESSISVPKGLYFDKSHTWAFMEKDGNVRIGIDDFLQRVTGQITRVDMKQPGDKIKRGEKLVSIAHKGKQLNIYSPVSGIIKDYNRSITNNASLINSAPYSDGWIYMVEPANWAGETRILSMADNYIKWLYEEFARLKDFLAINLNSDRLNYSRIVLQDGGMLKEDILQDLSPKIWEDFQTDFLDPSR
jgi:glycine cleavage system H lipoate-binding protein